MFTILICGLLFWASIALAGTESISGVVDIGTNVVLIMGMLKGVSWIFGMVAEKTEVTWDNKAAKWFSKTVSWLGWAIGQFGIGNVPNSVKHRPKLALKMPFKRKM